MFHISFVSLLLYYCMYPTGKIPHTKKCMPAKLLAGGPLSEISYIPLLSVMTLHFHRVYKIKSLEANLILDETAP